METRTFLAGVAVGLVVGALAAIASRPERTEHGEGDSVPAGNLPQGSATSRIPSADATPTRTAVPATLTPGSSHLYSPPAPAREPGSTADATLQDPDAEILESFADRWSEAPSAAELSNRLKTESRDDAWASYMETQLRDFLARRPFPNAIGTISIRCAMTDCRLVSAVNQQIWTGVPNTDVQSAMNELPNESLGRELTFVMSSIGGHPNDDTMLVIVVFLKRAEGSPGISPE